MWKIISFIAISLVLVRASPLQEDNINEISDPEIYKGNTANDTQWPWMAYIKDRCGGVLLAKRWVLTAAACVKTNQDYEVVVGEFDRNVTSGNEQTITVMKEDIQRHPDFNPVLYTNDLALLKLSTPATFDNTYVRKILALADDTTDEVVRQDKSTECYVAGWGRYTDERGVWMYPNELQELKVTIISNERCEKLIPFYITATNICFRASGAGTCTRDEGSPVMCKVNKKWTLMGVYSVSSSLDGCRGGARAATRLSQYRDWISGIINSSSVD